MKGGPNRNRDRGAGYRDRQGDATSMKGGPNRNRDRDYTAASGVTYEPR